MEISQNFVAKNCWARDRLETAERDNATIHHCSACVVSCTLCTVEPQFSFDNKFIFGRFVFSNTEP